MNENINLCEILKDCPKGTKLYSTVYGESKFRGIVDGPEPIAIESYSRLGVKSTCYTSDGRVNQYSHGECVLFPSKNQRDWSKFERFWEINSDFRRGIENPWHFNNRVIWKVY